MINFPLSVWSPTSFQIVSHLRPSPGENFCYHATPAPGGDGTDDRLGTGMDMDVLDGDALLTLAAVREQYKSVTDGPSVT